MKRFSSDFRWRDETLELFVCLHNNNHCAQRLLVPTPNYYAANIRVFLGCVIFFFLTYLRSQFIIIDSVQ